MYELFNNLVKNITIYITLSHYSLRSSNEPFKVGLNSIVPRGTVILALSYLRNLSQNVI
jgi:hypothetical protein